MWELRRGGGGGGRDSNAIFGGDARPARKRKKVKVFFVRRSVTRISPEKIFSKRVPGKARHVSSFSVLLNYRCIAFTATTV